MLTVFVGILTGCNDTTEDENIVYTTVYPVRYLVEEIAKEHVTVKRVPGSQTHSESIDWTPKEIIDMIESDIIFFIDAGVDSYIPNNADGTFDDSNAELVNLSEAITYNMICASGDHHHHDEEEHDEEHTDEHADEHDDEHDEGVLETCEINKIIDDPHFWLDPVRMLEAAEFVKDTLIAEFPEYEDEFLTNFEALKTDLEKLHTDYELMASEAVKPIITTSLLFSYYEARYDIEIIAMATTPHSGENIPGDIIEITEEAIYHEIHYVIYEKNVNSPAADALYEELSKDENYEVFKGYLHGLGTLITEEFDTNQTYLSIMYDNLETLQNATK